MQQLDMTAELHKLEQSGRQTLSGILREHDRALQLDLIKDDVAGVKFVLVAVIEERESRSH